tara:strand:+ start:564 stop:1952 length:1389 start_codon:yes stop_codon:yes gene_type:complete
MKKINLYIPIEHKVRELNSKIFFSLFALKKNFRCYLGNKEDIERVIKFKKDKNVIFFFKGGETRSYIKKIRDKVDTFFIIDEEAGPSDDFSYAIQRQRIHADVEDLVDKYYSIGPKNFKIAKKVYKNIDVKMTGWPRIDFFRAKTKNSSKFFEIKKKYKKFILYISDFGEISKEKNEISKKEYIDYLNRTHQKSKKKLITEFEKNQNKIFNEFLLHKKFLKILDKNRNIPQIIIRPHPYDDFEVWFELEKKFKRIKIIYEGDIYDWIKASEFVLHRGCSTALLAYLNNKKVGYLALKNKYIRNNLSFQISDKINSIQNLISYLKYKKQKIKRVKLRNLKKIIKIDEREFSSEKIIRDLIRLKPKKTIEYYPDLLTIYKSFYWNYLRRGKNLYFLTLIKIFRIFNFKNNYYNYLVTSVLQDIGKIGKGISYGEIEDTIKNLNIFKMKIKMRKILSNCFVIEKN